MNRRRRQHNLTVLADGSVLATGGQSTNGGGGLVDLANAVYEAERWDPATGAVDRARAGRGRPPVPLDRAAAARRPRADRRRRHLRRLPPGRLPAPRPGDLHAALPVPEGRQRRARPAAGRSPARRPRSATTARSRSARRRRRGIRKLGLVRLGAPTHSEDQSQRYVPLSFTAAGTTLDRGRAQQPQRGARRPLHAVRGRRRRRALGEHDRRARAHGRRRAPAAARAGQPGAQPQRDRHVRPAAAAEGPAKAVNGSVSGGPSDKFCTRSSTAAAARRPRREPDDRPPSSSSTLGPAASRARSTPATTGSRRGPRAAAPPTAPPRP